MGGGGGACFGGGSFGGVPFSQLLAKMPVKSSVSGWVNGSFLGMHLLQGSFQGFLLRVPAGDAFKGSC